MKWINQVLNFKLISCIQILILSLFIYTLFRLNVLPFSYSCIITIVLVVLNVLLWFGNRKDNLLTKLITIILCLLLIVPITYMNKSIDTLGEITEVNDETNRIVLIVKNDSNYHEVSDLQGKDIQTNKKYNAVAIEDTIDVLNESIGYHLTDEVDFIKMATNLYEGEVDALLMNEAYLWVMEHKYETFEKDTRIIWTYEHKKNKENITKPISNDMNCFNVFISGIDTRGDVSTVSRSDVNMLATVNMTTNQILLTSIPRDYYVYIPEIESSDKITHAGLNGVNSSVSTVEKLLDIDINYYVRVNFTSLITMVDALGGIDVYSDYEFGYPGRTYYIQKGYNHLNGERALVFSRERYALPNGDNDRIKNQQKVIQGMINKLISPTIITNYIDILDAVSGSFETNMSMKEITNILKKQLETMKSWDVQSYALRGRGTYFTGGAMMPDAELYYCIPDQSSIKEACDYIDMMINNETIQVK